MSEKNKAIPYVEVTALTIGSILVAMLSGVAVLPAVVVGGLTTAGGVIGNLIANRIQADRDVKQALRDALDGGHFSTITADACSLVILSQKRSDGDTDTVKIAECMRRYWERIHPQNEPTIAAYADTKLAERLVEYFEGDISQPKILMPQWVSILKGSIGEAGLEVDEFRINELAGALCRDFPRRLHDVFITDLSADGSGFRDVVLRLLCEISRAIKQMPTSSVIRDHQELLTSRLEYIGTLIVQQTKVIRDSFTNQTRLLLDRLSDVRLNLEVGFERVNADNEKLKTLMEEVLRNQQSQSQLKPDYESALATVASKHGLTPAELSSLLKAYARTIASEGADPLEVARAKLAAGEFSEAEDLAKQLAQASEALSKRVAEALAVAREGQIKAWKVACLAALQGGD